MRVCACAALREIRRQVTQTTISAEAWLFSRVCFPYPQSALLLSLRGKWAWNHKITYLAQFSPHFLVVKLKRVLDKCKFSLASYYVQFQQHLQEIEDRHYAFFAVVRGGQRWGLHPGCFTLREIATSKLCRDYNFGLVSEICSGYVERIILCSLVESRTTIPPCATRILVSRPNTMMLEYEKFWVKVLVVYARVSTVMSLRAF